MLSFTASKTADRRRKIFFWMVILITAVLFWYSRSFARVYFVDVLSVNLSGFLVHARNSALSGFSRGSHTEKINALAQENAKLAQENALLKDQMKEQKIQFFSQSILGGYNLIETKVIGNDNFLATPTIYISGGNEKGIEKNMAVLNENGSLVGIINESQNKISIVILLSHHNSRVGAKIAGTSWDGVVKGSRDLRAVLEMLPLESDIKTGDEAVTDNRNPDIPANLLLGKVAFVRESDDRLFKEAVLDLPYDSKNLSKVWVVTGRK